MSDERYSGPEGDDRDPEVSRLYREIATERAPTTLNEIVLQRAARHGRRAYPRWAPWLRPLAWAATIALSVAIVLDISRAPEQDPLPARGNGIDAGPAATPSTAGQPESLQKSEVVPQAPAPETAPEPEPARRDADAFRPASATALEEAADIARLRGSGSRQADGRAAAAEDTQAPPACDEAARRTPQAWFDCIDALRADGDEAAASRELRALLEAFPDAERR